MSLQDGQSAEEAEKKSKKKIWKNKNPENLEKYIKPNIGKIWQ